MEGIAQMKTYHPKNDDKKDLLAFERPTLTEMLSNSNYVDLNAMLLLYFWS